METHTIDQVMQQAIIAFDAYQQIADTQKAVFLEKVADNIEALGDDLIVTTAAETNLPHPRLMGERTRTTSQLRMFATMLREGSWVQAVIDTAIPDRNPPRTDTRKMMIPLGPVVVFGASNFPYAYSTAGGDTASALAAGCSVVVKAHPAHLKTSILIAQAIQEAASATGMPENILQHVTDTSFEAGKNLVQHPHTAAVGFTGSFTGGKALYDYAAQRNNPIPVFAEMGSVNPVLLLPEILEEQTQTLAAQYAASITLGMGQFCTNPGILLAVKGEALEKFITLLGIEISKITPAAMLHTGIATAYATKRAHALAAKGVTLVAAAKAENEATALPSLATVDGNTFLQNPLLHEEVFGPYSLVVRCADQQQLLTVWQLLKGQLTTTIMGTVAELNNYPGLLSIARSVAGRIVFNGVPTGVEVVASMVHGGPFPATTDSRYTAVGTESVKRWIRPICYQNCPDALLPDALKTNNPLGISRLVNGEWTH